MIILAWFYYSFYYLLLGAFITIFINRLTKKLYIAPLLINAISGIMLIVVAKYNIISAEQATYALYFNYMPTVAISIIINLILYINKKIKGNTNNNEQD